jgi:hypothetical protein
MQRLIAIQVQGAVHKVMALGAQHNTLIATTINNLGAESADIAVLTAQD